MASLQLRGSSYACAFRFHGRRYFVTLGEVTADEASEYASRVKSILTRLKLKYISLPPGTGIVDFIQNDGKPPTATAPVPEKKTFGDLRDRYLREVANGSIEDNTLLTLRIHLNHWAKTLGDGFPMRELSQAEVQGHINRRVKKKYRGKPISAVTIEKEVKTLRALWRWAAGAGFVSGEFPGKSLRYPKAAERLPFATWEEIERRVALGESENLWDCLFLQAQELPAVLEFVRVNATADWLYPMVVAAAHTGARRSELLRAKRADVNLKAKTITIQEKKRKKGRLTTRSVPLTPLLAQVLTGYLDAHPGGLWLFTMPPAVPHSKGKAITPTPVTKDEAHDHLRRTLDKGKHKVIRGWHVFRHSFISALVAKGIDQRLIDEMVGHQTEEQRRRYRHLTPQAKDEALRSVFGG